MKTFLAVYTGSLNSPGQQSWADLSEAERQERQAKGMQAWGGWMQDHAGAVTVPGGPLGTTKRVGPGGISDIKNNLSGFTILQAESHEAAAKLFENHPHFAIFPGEAVEVMEVMPIPGQ